MINLLIGAPGGGKSYEAVVFHILPALAGGRKVITNLPLDLERVGSIDPSYLALIEKRETTRKARPEGVEGFNAYPFAHPEDYADPWRHPDTGAGPLYVIDECHIALPKIGTPVPVEVWYSMHRHELADVLLITQSYGKINASVRDLVQVVYRVRKNIAFGSAGSYTRKVQDGIRGDVVNTTIRTYKRQYFGLYKSHTRSGAGSELGAQDIRPIWKHWSFIGAGICLAGVLVMLANGAKVNPISTEPLAAKKPEPIRVRHEQAPDRMSGVVPGRNVESVPDPQLTPEKPEPYKSNGLHIVGAIHMAGRSLYQFAVSQNGQQVALVTSVELSKLGYAYEAGTDCAGWLTWGKTVRAVTCDTVKIGVAIPATAG